MKRDAITREDTPDLRDEAKRIGEMDLPEVRTRLEHFFRLSAELDRCIGSGRFGYVNAPDIINRFLQEASELPELLIRARTLMVRESIHLYQQYARDAQEKLAEVDAILRDGLTPQEYAEIINSTGGEDE